MAAREEMIAITRTYDLIGYAVPLFQKFPKLHRFSLGVRMENELYDVLMELVSAKYSRSKGELLRGVNLRIEKSRFLARLACDFRVLSVGAYKEVAKRLDEVGRLVGGWIKKAKS